MFKFITIIYSKSLRTVINNYLKYIFLILIILTLVVSYICLIQSFTSRYEYTPSIKNDKNSAEITEKNKTLEILRNSDNPSNFKLSSDKNIVTEGGIFTLSWTPSKGAENYSIYSSTKNITIIDGDCTLIKENLTRLNHSIIAGDIGLIYYVVEAYNKSGSTLSNTVKIQIIESEGSSDKKAYSGDMLSATFVLIPILVIAIILLLSFSGIMRYKAKRRLLYAPTEEEFHDEEIKTIRNIKSGTEILNETINNSYLLDSIEQDKDLGKFELSSISSDFLTTVDKFKWDYETQKAEFIKEMLTLTPEEREDIINYMNQKSGKNDFIH
ncbi:MAG: hypothetical protein ACFFDK_17950 [Promethearchaeota archaeon]